MPDPAVKADVNNQRRLRKEAMKKVNELLAQCRKDNCGKVEVTKPNDVLRVLFENVNSIGVFSTGKAKIQKLNQMTCITALLFNNNRRLEKGRSIIRKIRDKTVGSIKQ